MATQTLKELEKLYTKEELIDLINVRRTEKAAAEEQARVTARATAVDSIKELLRTAERALRDAGELGDRHGISFKFVGPKNDSEYFRPGWQSSACYVSDGWYAAGDFGYGYQDRNLSSVDGEDIPPLEEYDNYRWASSSADC